jgi:hypothetical protein
MKKLATITNEEFEVTLHYGNHHLYSKASGEPTTEIGPRFEHEGEAVDYIFAAYGHGWNLIWEDVD